MANTVLIFFLLSLSAAVEAGTAEFSCAGFAAPASLRSGGSAKVSVPIIPFSNVPLLERGGVRALVIFAKFADEAPDIERPPDYAAKLLARPFTKSLLSLRYACKV